MQSDGSAVTKTLRSQRSVPQPGWPMSTRSKRPPAVPVARTAREITADRLLGLPRAR
jgi:hypothetical protein